MPKLRLTTFQRALFLLNLAACAASASMMDSPQEQCVPTASWIYPQHIAQGTVPAPKFIADLARQRVVLLGETHSNVAHHRWQLQTISALYAQRPNMVLGLEMFPRRAQGVLNRWIAGELSEAEFIKESDWKRVWNYDAAPYLSIFNFARKNKIPMLALNIDRDLISAVSKRGWEGVPKGMREGVSDPAPASQAYLEYLSYIFQQHGRFKLKLFERTGKVGEVNFRHFVAGQLTWDRAMAQAISALVRESNAPLVVGMIGSGHLMYRYGVPHQLADLGINGASVVLPWDQSRSCGDLQPGLADAVFGISAPPKPLYDSNPGLGAQQVAADQSKVGEPVPANTR